MRWVVGFSLLALTACATSATSDGQSYVSGCSSNADCPLEFVCKSGACKLKRGPLPDAPGTSTQSTPISIECHSCAVSADCGDPASGCWLPDATGSNAFCAYDCTRTACPTSDMICLQDTGDEYKTCAPAAGSCTASASSGGSAGSSSGAGATSAGSSGGSSGTSAGSSGGSSGTSSGGSTGSSAGAGATSGSSSGGTTCTSDTWANYESTFFATNCSNCHRHASELNTYAGVKADSQNVKAYIGSGSMPPSSTLSASDINRVTKWIDCGLPQ